MFEHKLLFLKLHILWKLRVEQKKKTTNQINNQIKW